MFRHGPEWRPEDQDHIKYPLFMDGQRGREKSSNASSNLAVNDSQISDGRSLAALADTAELQIHGHW